MKRIILALILNMLITMTFFSFYEKTNDIRTTNKKIEETLNNMTLDEKIGQMLIITSDKTSMDDSLKEELKHVGGFILFSHHFTSYDKTLEFINDIKSTSEIPMFISVDQEGGKVQRLKTLEDMNATIIPTMWDLGKMNDTNLSYEVGSVIAKELQVFGINMNFAPVIDIVEDKEKGVIKTRSFGSNATLVSNMAFSLAEGLEDNGVIPVYKHFPGHGATIVDSHYDLPVITKTKEELLKSDLIPFSNAIKNGAKVIMIGHLAIPNITNDNTPASLSKILITDILKNEMNYQGLVITDALNMKAVTDNYSEESIYVKAINAGVDILLMPKSSNSAIRIIKENIEKGNIKEEQIDESVRKILTLKYNSIKDINKDLSVLGSIEHQKIIDKVIIEEN